MKHLLSYPQNGSRILLFWCAATLVYCLMVFGSLADIEQITGVRAFDMRLTGYSYADALALISALGEEGRRIYLTVQIPMDTVYPAFFCDFERQLALLVVAILWLDGSMVSSNCGRSLSCGNR